MKKIVVAPDSFKGSLTSAEVADAVERGIKDVFPQCNVVKAGVADGGEGTVEAIVKAVGGAMYAASVTDPLGRPVKATYGIVRSGGVKTAVMEMSAASGLPLLLPDELNPWITSTYGTGEMISDALNRGCRKFLVGIGGSATNDAGTGMLSALGVRFLDSSGQRLKGCGKDLESIARIDMSSLIPAARESEIYRSLRCQHPLLRTGRSCPCLCSPKRSEPSNHGSPGPRHAFLCPGDSRTVPDRHSTPERSRCSRRIRRRFQSLFKCQADRRD